MHEQGRCTHMRPHVPVALAVFLRHTFFSVNACPCVGQAGGNEFIPLSKINLLEKKQKRDSEAALTVAHPYKNTRN